MISLSAYERPYVHVITINQNTVTWLISLSASCSIVATFDASKYSSTHYQVLVIDVSRRILAAIDLGGSVVDKLIRPYLIKPLSPDKLRPYLAWDFL